MTPASWLISVLFGSRIARDTHRYLAAITQEQSQHSRRHVSALLKQLAEKPGPHVLLGETDTGQAVKIPLALLTSAYGIITGGTGSGKTMSAMPLVEAILAASEADMSFGVVDAKGELFERTLYFVLRAIESLAPEAAERLRERLVIVDLGVNDPVTSLNIAAPWSAADLDYFATSRMETLQELFPSGDGLSLRGGSILKHVIKLLAEQRVPFSHFDHVLSSDDFRAQLLSASTDDELRTYFQVHFPSEGRATIAAVRARLNATLLGSTSLRLALSGTHAPDFRALQDEGAIVLVNCTGPNIPRAAARTLQGLVLADIRQGVFSRRNQRPFLWLLDEAQNFFRSKYLRDNMVDLLTMSRSFGSHCVFLTQNLSTAVQDSEILETLHTNIRWSLTLRGTAKDAAFLQPALPISGRRQKPRTNPYAPADFYSLSEERVLLMQDVAHLPDRVAWCWLKSLTGEAFRIRTRTLDIPTGSRLKEDIEPLRGDPAIGRRCSRSAYLDEIARRDAGGSSDEHVDSNRDLVAELTELYRSSEGASQ